MGDWQRLFLGSCSKLLDRATTVVGAGRALERILFVYLKGFKHLVKDSKLAAI